MTMKAIVAVDDEWAIGKDNDLLFRISDDLKRFKELTTGNIIVMGRKTFESLPDKKPLPNRTNIILTTDMNYKVDGAEVVHSVYDLIAKVTIIKSKEQKVFVIGGESVYSLLLPLCDEILVTKIYGESPGADRFFPNLDRDCNWYNEVEENPVIKRDKTTGLYYGYVNYKSRKLSHDN